MHTDEVFMREALALAAATVSQASPNPQVGCVLTRKIADEEKIIARGAHLYAARDHAEIAALKQVVAQGHSIQGATAYVTLEPCSHHGRTPPCADALIAAGIIRCVIATADPNPLVAGRGIEKLRAAGISVTVGTCQAEARALNNAFAFAITHKRPFVTLKAALSTDGMLAPSPAHRIPNQPHWLTGPESRAEVQRLRHASDAILTGIGTVLADDPALTDRTGLPRRRPLLRVVLDSCLRIPLTSRLIESADNDLLLVTRGVPHHQGAAEIIVGTGTSPLPQTASLQSVGAEILQTASLTDLLIHLHQRGILSLLLEAGPTLNAAFLRANLVDQAILFYAPVELGPTALPFAHNGPTPFALEQQMLSVHKQSFGPDVCVSGLLHNPWQSAPNLV